ncbi:MAG: glycerol-3-phosphate 1-O-acyltransferase [Deltaproteobacteria bacterium]|nr:MAG: glycerol-3-phosphate 1-O-acyltransferase [Deltaproteobacteria bacterium]
MTPLVASAALVAIAYFAGSIPTGVLVARARGVDLRAVGSGNIGATNVARALGKRVGVAVLVADAAKGAAPAAAGLWLQARGLADPVAVAAAGFAAIAGHCFPVWLGFRGGKGVATSLGVFAVLAPDVTALAAALWIALYAAFRIASVGSLAASAAFVPLLWLRGYGVPTIALAGAAVALIAVKHRDNVARLVRHAEHRV